MTAPAEAPSGKEQLWRALRHPSRAQIIVGLLLGLVAFAGVTQVRASETNDAYAGLRQSELVQALTGLNAASARAEREIEDLRSTRSDLTSSTEKGAAALKQAQTELAALSILAGTSPATGPGIVMEVQMGDEPLGINQFIDCIQELRDAGAEAMAINDTVRVVAQTWFEADGDDIIADGRAISAPYRITAIGDPATLETALDIQGGFRDDINDLGGSVDVEQRDKVTIDAVRSIRQPEFAEPVG